MEISKIEFHTRPFTLGDFVAFNKIKEGDMEAYVAFLVSRTNLTRDEVLTLTTEDLVDIMPKLEEAIVKATALSKLSASWKDQGV